MSKLVEVLKDVDDVLQLTYLGRALFAALPNRPAALVIGATALATWANLSAFDPPTQNVLAAIGQSIDLQTIKKDFRDSFDMIVQTPKRWSLGAQRSGRRLFTPDPPDSLARVAGRALYRQIQPGVR